MQVCLVFIARVYISLQRDVFYQSTKGWLCPDRSRCNNVLISVETEFNPRNEISVFHSLSPSVRRPRIRAFQAFKPYF